MNLVQYFGSKLSKRNSLQTRSTQFSLSTHFPSFEHPVSQLVTAEQIRNPEFDRWRLRLDFEPGLNRKLWEYVYIGHVLEKNLDFTRSPRILGFGVGKEKIPAALATAGCSVVATDYADASAHINSEWSCRSLEDLFFPALCDRAIFDRSVEFRVVDMTNISTDLRNFDGLWSCGSLEHIGGLKAGADFVKSSLECLKPGGFAVHTTEYNLSSDVYTHEDPYLCFYRRKDILALAAQLHGEGHSIALTLEREDTLENNDVDRPPFSYSFTMNAQHGLFVITSIGLIIQKRR